MKTPICEEYGIEFPIFAFSHSPDVVAAVSKTGGMGVLGASGMSPEELDHALQKITLACHGKPFGIDLILPDEYVGKDQGGLTEEELEKQIPEEHKQFVATLLKKYGVENVSGKSSWQTAIHAGASVSLKEARALVDVALQYPIKLLVNALGVFPNEFLEKAKAKNVKTGALVGQVKHALKQKEAGVDLIIAQGYEAGGHTGEIANMVLVPQVVDAVKPTPVVMAGGVADGRQIAAALALGAQGVWTGSVWLMTEEAETHPVVKEKFKKATSTDTIRSRSITGKHARQLKSAWTDAWEDPDNPEPLPMPLQGKLVKKAKEKIDIGAAQGNPGAVQLINYFVGQNVGMLREEKPAAEVFRQLVNEWEATMNALGKMLDKAK